MQTVVQLWFLAALPALSGNVGWLAVGEVVSVGAGGPAFAPRQRTAELAAVGQPATLHCRILRLGDKSVSWVRSRDLQILSHAGAVFTADARVSATETRADSGSANASSHELKIERLRVADGGRYECQVNTDPKLSLFFNLTVIDEPVPVVVVRALGGSAVRGARGGAGTLACEARLEPAPRALQHAPPALSWRRRGADPPDLAALQRARGGGVSLDTERWAARVVSRLTLAPLSAADAGVYECVEDSGAGDAVTLTLDDDEEVVEAMQRDQSALSGATPLQRLQRLQRMQWVQGVQPVLLPALLLLKTLLNR